MKSKNSATIVFCDIVGFSKIKTDHEQSKLIRDLSVEVKHQLYSFLAKTDKNQSFITIPTGDGLIIALVENNQKDKDKNKDRNFDWTLVLFTLIERLMSWKADNKVGLRVGVHYGPVNIVSDINNTVNLIGSTVNDCQRVMDAANNDQVLFSRKVYKKYAGSGKLRNKIPNLQDDRKVVFDGIHSIVVKHGVLQDVYVMHLGNKHASWWDNQPPKSKDFMPVSINPNAISNIEQFQQLLVGAKEIALVQFSGINLQSYIMSDAFKLSDELKTLWIFMPDPQYYPDDPISSLPTASDIHNGYELWKSRIEQVAERYPNADVKLKLFRGAPYFCGSFIDWKKKDGLIYVIPVVWGAELQEFPVVEMKWQGKNMPKVYKTYLDGLKALDKESTTVTE